MKIHFSVTLLQITTLLIVITNLFLIYKIIVFIHICK